MRIDYWEKDYPELEHIGTAVTTILTTLKTNNKSLSFLGNEISVNYS